MIEYGIDGHEGIDTRSAWPSFWAGYRNCIRSVCSAQDNGPQEFADPLRAVQVTQTHQVSSRARVKRHSFMQDDGAEPCAKRARMDAAQPGPNPEPATPAASLVHGTAGADAATESGRSAAPAAAVANGGPAGGRGQWMGGNVWLEEGVPPPLAPQRAAACYVCELPAIPGRHAAPNLHVLDMSGQLRKGATVQ